MSHIRLQLSLVISIYLCTFRETTKYLNNSVKDIKNAIKNITRLFFSWIRNPIQTYIKMWIIQLRVIYTELNELDITVIYKSISSINRFRDIYSSVYT